MRAEGPTFLCDAMLGGLARWLRAAGYDAEFACGVEDRQLIRKALATGATVLSSDAGLFERNVIKHKTVKALFVPRDLSKSQQLAYVAEAAGLRVHPEPRCMACGGELEDVPKESVRAEAPARAFSSCERFWRCTRCGKLLWKGTHWRRIRRTLAKAMGEPD